MLSTIRHETTLGGEPVTLEVRQLAAVPALRLLNRLTAVLAGGLAGLAKGKAEWLTDGDFEHLQRTLLARVGVRDAGGKLEEHDFEGFMARVGGESEVVLEVLWHVLQETYPRSFSAARRAVSDPTSWAKLLKGLGLSLPARAPRPGAPAASAPTAPATSAPAPLTTRKPSAY